MDIFIAESSIGRHVPCAKILNITLISFTFRISYQSILVPITDVCAQTYIRVSKPNAFKVDGVENPAKILDDVYNRDIIAYIKQMHIERGNCKIYLGQDNDSNGNLMASLLYFHLLNVGIMDTYIVRVPLIAVGYDYRSVNMGFANFYDKGHLLAILEADRDEQRKMNAGKGIGRVGYRNDFALAHVYDRKKEDNPRVKKLSNGTGTATYMTKKLLGERK